MQVLPKWVVANPFPALHDFESLTVLDQTARIYGAMNSLIEEYNKFAETVNDQLSELTESEGEARKEFEIQITKVMKEFMCSMEQYMKLNLEETATTLINKAINDGRILVQQYDPEAESLNIGLTGGV
jgi:hypothetical protein